MVGLLSRSSPQVTMTAVVAMGKASLAGLENTWGNHLRGSTIPMDKINNQALYISNIADWLSAVYGASPTSVLMCCAVLLSSPCRRPPNLRLISLAFHYKLPLPILLTITYQRKNQKPRRTSPEKGDFWRYTFNSRTRLIWHDSCNQSGPFIPILQYGRLLWR